MKPPTEGKIRLLARYSRNSTALVAATYVIQNGIRLVSSVVLTRLLMPEAYAVMGLVTSVAFVITMLTDVGFHAFMLRHERLGERSFRDTMWTIRFCRSCLLTLLFFFAADHIGLFMQKPEAVFALKIFSLTFVLDALAPISIITALADGRLRTHCVLDVITSSMTAIVSVCSALYYHDIYSLAYAALAGQLIRASLFRILLPDSFLVWRFDVSILKDLLKFGRYIVASSIITLLIMQVDKIGLSRILDSDRLGAYFLAINIAAVPRGLANAISSKSLYPAYSRSVDRRGVVGSRTLYDSRQFIDKAFAGCCFAGFLISGFIVSFLYDERYVEAGRFLGILFFGLTPLMWNLAINEFFVANGWTSITFKANMVRLVWIIAAALPFLASENEIMFLYCMAITEFVAYTFFLFNLARVRVLRLKQEAFCIIFGILSILIIGFQHFGTPTFLRDHSNLLVLG